MSWFEEEVRCTEQLLSWEHGDGYSTAVILCDIVQTIDHNAKILASKVQETPVTHPGTCWQVRERSQAYGMLCKIARSGYVRKYFRAATREPGTLVLYRNTLAFVPTQDRKNCRSVTKDNEWAGVLYLEEEQSLELVSEENHVVAGSLCEFALLSLTEKRSQKDGCDSVWNNSPQEWEYRARSKATGSHQFYSVLWIEWLHGIAYRRAYGQIKKALWDHQEIEYFDLILG